MMPEKNTENMKIKHSKVVIMRHEERDIIYTYMKNLFILYTAVE